MLRAPLHPFRPRPLDALRAFIVSALGGFPVHVVADLPDLAAAAPSA